MSNQTARPAARAVSAKALTRRGRARPAARAVSVKALTRRGRALGFQGVTR